MLLWLVGCRGGDSATAPSSSSLSLAGTWVGDAAILRLPAMGSSVVSQTAHLSLSIASQSQLTEAGVPLTGSWSMTYADSSYN
jgi:hypothetical protein